jgi:hypothetical protein
VRGFVRFKNEGKGIAGGGADGWRSSVGQVAVHVTREFGDAGLDASDTGFDGCKKKDKSVHHSEPSREGHNLLSSPLVSSPSSVLDRA